MDRLALGILIALPTLLMSTMVHDAAAAGPVPPPPARPGETAPAAVTPAPRGGAVLSLLLTLEALRTAPIPLDTSKV